ncbi:MAG: ABC transporter permease [Patescibacteria group bacterium]
MAGDEQKTARNIRGFWAGLGKRLIGRQEFGIFIAFILLFTFFALKTPAFGTFSNLMNLGRQISNIGIMAIGMTFLIICGEFDLSVGSIFAFVSGVSGLLMLTGMPIWVAVFLGLLMATAIGLINGLISTYGRIPSFITGLGMLNVLRGAFLLLTGGMPVAISGFLPPGRATDLFTFAGKGMLFGVVPMMFVFFLVLLAIGTFLLKKTRLGFHVYAVGGNPKAARIAGLNVEGMKIFAFMLTGLTTGIASLLQLSFIGTVTGQVGQGYELDAISAVIVGGTKLSGGDGSLLGTFLGAAIVGALRNGLVLIGVSPFWQMLAIGVVIVIAVGIDRWTARK